LTQRVKHYLFGEGLNKPLQVIPCCADLSHIENQAPLRDETRARLGIAEKLVMVYVGKFGGWYMQREMADFFAVAHREMPNLHFLVLTQSDPHLIHQELARHTIPEDDYTIMQVAPAEMGAYLAASDFAISFIEAAPSKIASSPTKLGEYLAAGLPVVCNRGVGDVDAIIAEHDVGLLIDDFTEAAYQTAVRQLPSFLNDDVRQRCRQAAHVHASLHEVGVPRYLELYAALA